MRSIIGRAFLATSRRRMQQVTEWQRDPVPAQERQLRELLCAAKDTCFGREHSFQTIHSVREYQARVPLRTYEEFKPYWDRLFQGETDITWPGRIRYFAVTSGTTSGNKLIPVSREAIRSHMQVGRDVVNFYLNRSGDVNGLGGKYLYLGGSTRLKRHAHGIRSGDLSGILTLNMPLYTRFLRLPTPRVAAIQNWEQRLDAIARQAWKADVHGIGGTPSWLVCLFERIMNLHRQAGRNVRTLAEVWPDLSWLVHGGVNFEPYRATFADLLGKPVNMIETYPASEGFIAVQDQLDSPDLLLMMDTGLFYEFVPVDELGSERPRRFTAADVEKDVNYAIVLTSNSGIWSYILGDTVRFSSLRPHRIRITGRTHHFLNAFGEHLIVEDVEKAIAAACSATFAAIRDYHVAPLYPKDKDVRPAHQWLVEFQKKPADMERFRLELDGALQRQNDDYAAHRQGNAGMRLPDVVAVPTDTFYLAMKRIGRFGPQNKAPRIRNDRQFAEVLIGVAEELRQGRATPESG